MSPEMAKDAGAEAVNGAEGNMCGTAKRGAVALPGSMATSRTEGSRRNLGVRSHLGLRISESAPGKPSNGVCHFVCWGIAKVTLTASIGHGKEGEIGFWARSDRAERRLSRKPLVRLGGGSREAVLPKVRPTFIVASQLARSAATGSSDPGCQDTSEHEKSCHVISMTFRWRQNLRMSSKWFILNLCGSSSLSVELQAFHNEKSIENTGQIRSIPSFLRETFFLRGVTLNLAMFSWC